MNLPGKYTQKLSDNSIHWLKEYKLTKGEFELHELRVSLKKIRPFIDFITFLKIHKKKQIQLKRNLQKIAHQAGFIRDQQLIIKWLKKNRYLLLLKESAIEIKLDMNVDYFIKDAAKNKKRLLNIKKELVLISKETNSSSVILFLQNSKLILLQLLQELKKEEWHYYRKTLKKILYATNWLPENEKIKFLTVKQFKSLDLLQEAIGLWHDALQIKTWLSEEQFFLNSNLKINLQFNKSWEKLKKELDNKERIVLQQLKSLNLVFKV